MCENVIEYSIPSGYTTREVSTQCGNTDYWGDLALCDTCIEKAEKTYPQGWRDAPGDICPHGNYVGDAHGPDYLCGECES